MIGPLFQWPCVTMVTIHMTYQGIWLHQGDSSHCAVNKSYCVFNVIRGTIPGSNMPQAFQEEMIKKDLWNSLAICKLNAQNGLWKKRYISYISKACQNQFSLLTSCLLACILLAYRLFISVYKAILMPYSAWPIPHLNWTNTLTKSFEANL